MTDVIDTLEISGGRPLLGVDAAAVHDAANNAGLAGDSLRAASIRMEWAVRALEDLALTPGPLLAPSGWSSSRSSDAPAVCDAGVAVRYRLVADDVRSIARHLVAGADHCGSLRDRLLRAAGLYEQGESIVEKVMGGIFEVGFAASTFVTSAMLPLPLKIVGEAVVAGAVPLVAALSGGGTAARDGKATSKSGAKDVATTKSGAKDVATSGVGAQEEATSTGIVGTLTAGLAPWTDEIVSGLGFGIAATHPLTSGFDFSVTGAARTLADLVHMLMPQTTASVREVRPDDLVARDDSTPTATILSAFGKFEGLYGRGATGEPIDVPKGTLSVERVTHEDGTTSWVVLIPGTQDGVSTTHPFDFVSDIDVMAKRSAETAAAVESALDTAGVPSDEPVVLIGHSLGGMTAVALAASPSFRRRYRIGGVVTAGSPTATFTVPSNVPVLHVENDEEAVSNLDGLSGEENPRGPNRVTVTRRVAASADPLDQQAAGNIGLAHGVPTHARTLAVGLESGNAQLAGVVEPIEALMSGTSSTTQYYAVERVVVASPEPLPAPSPGPAPSLGPAPSPGPGPSPAPSPSLEWNLAPVPSPRPGLRSPIEDLPGIGPLADDVPGVGAPPLTVTVPPLRRGGSLAGREG